MKAFPKTLAELQLTIHLMSQEAAFGLNIDFPVEVRYLSENKMLGELTEDEAQLLIRAGMRARHEAMYPNERTDQSIHAGA